MRVHLVLPRESIFTEQEHEAKAAVIVKTHGGRLPEQAQLAIPQLVASAVDGLRPENVTVVDADSNTPYCARGVRPADTSPTTSMRPCQKRWCEPWNRWSAPSTCVPTCMLTMT